MNSLPPSLDRFGGELENAVQRDLGSRRRRRRAIRGAVVLAVVAAAALGLLSVFGNGGPSVVDRAAAALQTSGGILHYSFDATQQNGDGATATWHQETWQLLVPPYTRRQIATAPNSPRAEEVSRGDLNELYDAGSGTIYLATSAQLRAARMPKIEIVSKSKLEQLTGSSKVSAAYVIHKGDSPPYKVIATEAGAKRLRQELTHPQGQTSGVLPEEFRSQILALLKSGKVRVVGHVTIDGRDAIELQSLSGKSTYFVDPATYAPIEWRTTGNGGGVTYRFSTFEDLPADADSMRLLSLRDQYPNAQVVRGAKAYIPEESHLYPHG